MQRKNGIIYHGTPCTYKSEKANLLRSYMPITFGNLFTNLHYLHLNYISSVSHIFFLIFLNYHVGSSNILTTLFLGFSVYVSNTTERFEGTLCFKDTNFTLDTIPAVFTTVCPLHGKFVIYYNERLQGLTYSKEYSPYAEINLCEVEVYGESCINQHNCILYHAFSMLLKVHIVSGILLLFYQLSKH